jgi:Trypsin
MRKRSWRTWLLLTTWAVVSSWGCDGCRQEHVADVPDSGVALDEQAVASLNPEPLGESLILPHRLLKLAGDEDFENRYQSTVTVTALLGEREQMACGGVALSHHVVLTAGHCVCRRKTVASAQGGAQAIIDSAECFEDVNVTTRFYKPPSEEGTDLRGSRMRFIRGKAQPHPALRVTLDEQGRISSSHADLALIFLEKSLDFPGMPLSAEKLRVGDTVTIVGYGFDEDIQVVGGDRRSCANKITQLATAEDERVLVQQPGGHRYRQDSGGPCLLQGRKGPELVGISSRWLGEGAAFISIENYHDWLREEVRRAETTRSAPR